MKRQDLVAAVDEPVVVSNKEGVLGSCVPGEDIESSGFSEAKTLPISDLLAHSGEANVIGGRGVVGSNDDAVLGDDTGGIIQRPRDLAPSNSQQHLQQRSLRGGCSENGSRQSSSLNRERRISPDHIPRMHECWSLEPVRRANNRGIQRIGGAAGDPSSEMSSLESFPPSSRQLASTHPHASGNGRETSGTGSTELERSQSGLGSTKPPPFPNRSEQLPPQPSLTTGGAAVLSPEPFTVSETMLAELALLADCNALSMGGITRYGDGRESPTEGDDLLVVTNGEQELSDVEVC
jgi:hypothetical protein